MKPKQTKLVQPSGKVVVVVSKRRIAQAATVHVNINLNTGSVYEASNNPVQQ